MKKIIALDPADLARLPRLPHCSAGDWWRALLVFVYIATGWRIGQCLGLRREDLDLGKRMAIARGSVEGNKGKVDQAIKLHPIAVDHLTNLRNFSGHVFEWPHHRRTLYVAFNDLQRSAGLSVTYGFHDLRRGFGTMNASRLDPKALQNFMQHADQKTTLDYYVNPLAAQDEAVARLYVPPGLTG